jgi:FKBP-type peptidyl-prolyl cis-trans isomerase FkpA
MKTSSLRRLLLVVSATFIAFPSCAQNPPAPAPEAPLDEAKVLYGLGQVMAMQLAQFGLSEADLAQIQKGLTDGVMKKGEPINQQVLMPQIQKLAADRAARQAKVEMASAEEFLKAKAAEAGAVKTESGLIYKELKAGTGASPAETDKVKVHYHGTLRSGEVFDSSVERGQPASFALNQVIKCWTEGVQKMKAGGKAQLVCPSSIAYGERGAPPRIPPGAALVFEVELLEINPAS